jgi:hypothetical protein
MAPIQRVSTRCDQQIQLFAKFTLAINRLIEAQRNQMSLLKSGRADVWHVDQEIEAANEARKQARDEYLKHIQEHGCG